MVRYITLHFISHTFVILYVSVHIAFHRIFKILLGLFPPTGLKTSVKALHTNIQTSPPVVHLAHVLLLVKAQSSQPQFSVKCTFNICDITNFAGIRKLGTLLLRK
jgi:hypothetical protein